MTRIALLLPLAACTLNEPMPEITPPPERPAISIGVTTLDTEALGEVEIWYPAADEAGEQPGYEVGGLTFDTDTLAFRDATPATGSWPLVVFSHGLGGFRGQSYFLTEALAAEGYVVIAMDHPGTTLADLTSENLGQAVGARLADLRDLVDLAPDALADLDIQLQSDEFHMIGHSLGSWTALAVGGGQVDPTAFHEACLDGGGPACNFFEGEDLTLLSDVVVSPDPRVRSVVAIAPGGWYAFGEDGANLKDVTRPLVIAGVEDADLPFYRENVPTWERLADGSPMVAIKRTGHWAFTDLCRIVPVVDCEGETAGFLDPAGVREIVIESTLAHLEQQPLEALELDPEEVDIYLTGESAPPAPE